jgi:hypothetical protein
MVRDKETLTHVNSRESIGQVYEITWGKPRDAIYTYSRHLHTNILSGWVALARRVASAMRFSCPLLADLSPCGLYA